MVNFFFFYFKLLYPYEVAETSVTLGSVFFFLLRNLVFSFKKNNNNKLLNRGSLGDRIEMSCLV